MTAKREKRIVVRVTDAEYEKFYSEASNRGQKVSAMVRDLVAGKTRYKRPIKTEKTNEHFAELILLLSELREDIRNAKTENRRIGTNINQIVKRINSGQLDDLKDSKEQLLELTALLLEINKRHDERVRGLDAIWRQLK